jgi:hypothetical protein
MLNAFSPFPGLSFLSRSENIMNEANRAVLIDIGSFHRMAPRRK